MNVTDAPVVPIWTLTTSEGSAPLPALADEGALSLERVTELRSALATFSSAPLVTLEAHPLPKRSADKAGLPLDALSPLAQELSRLAATSTKNASALTQSSEVLYRMVVPAKVAAQVSEGLVKAMPSKEVAGGIRGALVGAKGIAAVPSFVPVKTATAGAATGTAVGTVTAGGLVTVAAPLVLLAVAVGATAHAENQRRKATERITELLEQLHDDKLDRERNELDGCRDAIDKATGLLPDRGKVGASLGLDSAVHAINTAIQTATRRVKKWEDALDSFADNRVELSELEARFPGASGDGGAFRTHLELAALAIWLKRRVILLQGVEAGQSDPDNQFENFVRSLNDDQKRVLELEKRIDAVLVRVSELELRPPKRLIDKVMTRKQVDDLLDVAYRLRTLGAGIGDAAANRDVVIDIERREDGKLLVLPAHAA